MKTLLLVILLGAVATAQPPTFVATPTLPIGGAAAYDPQRHVVVIFAASLLTWEWDGSSFRQRHGVAHAGVSAAVWDPVHREILASNGGAWNGASWRYAANPTGWSLGAMAYDEARQRLVRVFTSGTPGVAEWDGQQWTRITPPASPGIGGELAWDPGRGRCVLAIGNPVSLWTWDGTQWSLLDGNGPMLGTYGLLGLTFDPGNNRLVVNSATGNPTVPETWVFGAAGWALLATPAGAGGLQTRMVWDGIGLLVHNQYVPTNGIWRLEGSVWRQLPFALPQARSDATFASSPALPGLVLFGGVASSGWMDDTWNFTGRWTRLQPAHSPPPRRGAVMAWSPRTGTFVLFGGTGPQNATLSDTWTWDGVDWVLHATVTAPTAPVHLLTDPAGTVLAIRRIAIGKPNDQWRWTGSGWRNEPSHPSPYSFAPVVGAYDPRRNVITAAVDTQIWEWDGRDWTRAGSAPGYWGSVPIVTWRPDTQRVLFLGSQYGSQSYEWDGANWTSVSFGFGAYTTGALTLAVDHARGRLAQFWAGAPELWLLTATPATAQRFGYGCALGPSPGLLTDGRPEPGEPAFGIGVTTLAANAPCVLAIGYTTQGQHLGSGCVAWLPQPPAVHFLVADAAGQARFGLPLPGDLALRGVAFLAQAAVLDPSRSLIGGLTFSDGLRITIGD